GAGGLLHGALLARVLRGDEHRLVVLGDERAAAFGVHRDGGEGLQLALVLAVHRHRVQRVVDAQLTGLAVGGDPQVAVLVEGEVVRRGDRRDLRLVVPGEVGVRVGGVAADHRDVPGERGGAGVVAGLGELQDVVVTAGAALVGRAGLHASVGPGGGRASC